MSQKWPIFALAIAPSLDGHENNRKFDDSTIKQLKKYTHQTSEAGIMARYWIENKLGYLEQEISDPISPIP